VVSDPPSIAFKTTVSYRIVGHHLQTWPQSRLIRILLDLDKHELQSTPALSRH
jgi:hypothetical protein